MPKLSKEEAALRAAAELELRRRREVEYELYQEQRESLAKFCCYINPGYILDPIHSLMATELEKVMTGETKRLIITCQPQVGKSQMASIYFPAFWMGKNPNKDMILSSYNDDLASDKSKQVRAVIVSEEYRKLFPMHSLRIDTRASGMWRLAPPFRGAMKVAGVGGGITGFGAELAIIDDPFKDWQDAQSAFIRDAVWRWYLGVFRTRIREGGAILLIMTRWHEDDLAGRLLQSPGWNIVRVPAFAETDEERAVNNRFLNIPYTPDPLGRAPGEVASPRRFSKKTMEEIKTDVGPMVWAAEYQQTPRALEGNRLKREWFNLVVDQTPPLKAYVRYWDKAGTAYDMGQKHGAATAGILMGIDADNNVYVLDAIQGWWSALQRENAIKDAAKSDEEKYGHVKIYVEQEPGSGGKESVDATIRNLVGFSVYADKPTGDKDQRLEPFAAQAEAGPVLLIRGSWNLAYIEELISVPNGLRRDQADATAGAFNWLTAKQVTAKRVPFTGLYRDFTVKDMPR
jgi:predicted phage terminase large subunit-like protein